MKISPQFIQGLECISVLSENEADTAVVFLHGYGANMHDLFPLWELWHQKNFDWYFPNAPLSIPMGPYEGRAWFSIDISKMEEAMRTGKSRELESHVPPEFAQTMTQLKSFLRTIASRYKKLIIGGFSQGAMCASHLACEANLKIDGLILLSGSLVAQDLFPSAVRSIPYYQSHGTRDPILPIEGAKLLGAKLASLNFSGKFTSFNGGHEIPGLVISEVKTFLNQFST